jgi:hypothetical protein
MGFKKRTWFAGHISLDAWSASRPPVDVSLKVMEERYVVVPRGRPSYLPFCLDSALRFLLTAFNAV